MPTEQPSNAPDQLKPRDADTPADALADETLDTQPGGGGLGPRSGNDGGTTPGNTHGTAPNAPIDTGLPAEDAAGEARRQT